MSPDRARSLVALALCSAVLLPGCAVLKRDTQRTESSTAQERAAAAAGSLTGYLELLQRLIGATPAEQAEIVATVRREYEASPSGTRQLRYGLALAMPNHAAADPVAAERLLRELVATPETLQPVERALASVELAQLTRQLNVVAETTRTQAELLRAEREKTAAAQRRLKAESDDNERLRRALEEARAKLDAIANIERTLSERQAGGEGRQP